MPVENSHPSPAWRPSRREFLGTLGLALLTAACTSKAGPDGTSSPSGAGPSASGPTPAAGSLEDLVHGTEQISVISSNTPVGTGTVRFAFALSDAKNALITGGTPQVYVATDQTSKAAGPFPATWYPFTAYDLTHDTSPKTQLAGTYQAQIAVPTSGNWLIGVIETGSSGTGFGTAALAVTPEEPPHAVGSKATSTPTPVATADDAIAAICTRVPVCHLHAISLDAALQNGKPTVVSFATPLLCESQLCGPVVDEQILSSEHAGAKANFIHVEEFLPGPTHTPPPATLENQSPGFKAWHLETEPWVFVIDRGGVIQASFEGPVTAAMLDAALQPLL
jgi:hypothetical protein